MFFVNNLIGAFVINIVMVRRKVLNKFHKSRARYFNETASITFIAVIGMSIHSFVLEYLIVGRG